MSPVFEVLEIAIDAKAFNCLFILSSLRSFLCTRRHNSRHPEINYVHDRVSIVQKNS